MPTYIYACENGHTQPINHSMFEEPKTNCKQCGGGMRRKPSEITITFKGSGFASNDK